MLGAGATGSAAEGGGQFLRAGAGPIGPLEVAGGQEDQDRDRVQEPVAGDALADAPCTWKLSSM